MVVTSPTLGDPISGMPGWRDYSSDAFCLAVDLGQSVDPTAIAVIQHHRAGRMHVHGDIRWETDEYHIRHLARLPLGLAYPVQVSEVQRLLARPPLDRGCGLVLDETGVGRAVGDIFDAAGLRPLKVTITAGDEQTGGYGDHGRARVPKGQLISAVDAHLHTGQLKFAADLTEASAMAEELKDFRRKVSAAGRYSYDARVGKHDDLVLAVSLGLWFFTGKPKPSKACFGVYGTRLDSTKPNQLSGIQTTTGHRDII